jgi:hypothetical protein
MSGMLRAIADSVVNLGQRLGQARELDQLSREELEAVARDLSLTPGDIVEAVRLGPGVSGEALRMLHAFGIDPSDPRAGQFSTRDAARTCLHCDERERCHDELDAGAARENAAEFCPNAATFESLAATVPATKAECGCGGCGCGSTKG